MTVVPGGEDEKGRVQAMICFVDIEHEQVLQDPLRRNLHLAYCMDVKLKLEGISGSPCIVQRFGDVTRQGLKRLGIRAIVISGNATNWIEYPDDAWVDMYHIIREAEWPILGICGGHQLIAMAHGAPVGPIRALHPGEPDITSLSGPGYLKEWGFTSVSLVKADPVFDGLGQPPVFLEMHYWEVKQVPVGFEILASSDQCRVQVMKRSDRPVYGTQFHPEGYTDGPCDSRSILVNLVYPEGYGQQRSDGKVLLASFLRVAGNLG